MYLRLTDFVALNSRLEGNKKQEKVLVYVGFSDYRGT